MRARAVVAAAVLTLTGCTTSQQSGSPDSPIPTRAVTAGPTAPSASARPSAQPTPSRASASTPTPSTSTTPRPSASTSRQPAARFDSRAAIRDVQHLAGDIGPREATSRAYARAADFVEERLSDLGYLVRRSSVGVPAGDSWGTPVKKGRSVNVIAEPLGFDPGEPYVVIGAHLDTVAVSPGAEDNASGVAVLLELARLAARRPPGIPVQLIAFGAEEPRGSGDARHHFGSQQHVGDLTRAQRRAIRAMVSLDRVGVQAGYVPVCRGGGAGSDLRAELRAAARRVDVRTRACGNRSSDHWSFEKADIPAVRLGSIPYAGYHSRGDVVSVVDRGQLDKVGRLMWSWLQRVDQG